VHDLKKTHDDHQRHHLDHHHHSGHLSGGSGLNGHDKHGGVGSGQHGGHSLNTRWQTYQRIRTNRQSRLKACDPLAGHRHRLSAITAGRSMGDENTHPYQL